MKTLHEAIERVVLSAKQGLPYGIADYFNLVVSNGDIQLCIRSTISKASQTVALSLHSPGSPDPNEVQQIRIDGDGEVIDTYNSVECPNWIHPSRLSDPDAWVTFIEDKGFASYAMFDYHMEVHNERKESIQ